MILENTAGSESSSFITDFPYKNVAYCMNSVLRLIKLSVDDFIVSINGVTSSCCRLWYIEFNLLQSKLWYVYWAGTVP